MKRFLKRIIAFPVLSIGFQFACLWYLFLGTDLQNKISDKVLDVFLWSKK